jgi:hypothetical protein
MAQAHDEHPRPPHRSARHPSGACRVPLGTCHSADDGVDVGAVASTMPTSWHGLEGLVGSGQEPPGALEPHEQPEVVEALVACRRLYRHRAPHDRATAGHLDRLDARGARLGERDCAEESIGDSRSPELAASPTWMVSRSRTSASFRLRRSFSGLCAMSASDPPARGHCAERRVVTAAIAARIVCAFAGTGTPSTNVLGVPLTPRARARSLT